MGTIGGVVVSKLKRTPPPPPAPTSTETTTEELKNEEPVVVLSPELAKQVDALQKRQNKTVNKLHNVQSSLVSLNNKPNAKPNGRRLASCRRRIENRPIHMLSKLIQQAQA